MVILSMNMVTVSITLPESISAMNTRTVVLVQSVKLIFILIRANAIMLILMLKSKTVISMKKMEFVRSVEVVSF